MVSGFCPYIHHQWPSDTKFDISNMERSHHKLGWDPIIASIKSIATNLVGATARREQEKKKLVKR
jgi:hypothetical protein